MTEGHVYFHSPCFDGIASAVLVTDWMESQRGWSHSCLHVVNYHLRNQWLAETLQRPCATVDFLFHPESDFWADHHSTTFMGDSRPPVGKQEYFVYDRSAGSCAGLLWRHLMRVFGYRNRRFSELVQWAEKIDAARYDSVEETLSAGAPALRINAALSQSRGDDFPAGLVRLLRTLSVSEVADFPEVKGRFERFKILSDLGLTRFKQASWLEDDIVVFDVDAMDVTVNRYAPYQFYPQARYSAGVVRTSEGAKITVMRNPWLEFKSAPLGEICERYGGGGHERVGAILLKGTNVVEAKKVLNHVVGEIRRYEGMRRGSNK